MKPRSYHLAHFRFYEELNDFLPADRKKVLFPWAFQGNPSVKSAIEAIGVPHVEVDLILINSQPVDFSHKIRNGDSISVYPVFESFDLASVSHLRQKPLRDLKFIADAHLGKLTKYMRLCGLDTSFMTHQHDHEIINLALQEKRVILTRDREMLKNGKVTHGYWVRSEIPREQIKEVISRFDLTNCLLPYSRCLVCNNAIVEVAKESILSQLLPETIKCFNEYWKCVNCGRIYWKGSHWERMRGMVEESQVTNHQ